MACRISSKVFAASATVTLGIFAVYGVIGSIFYYKDLSKFPQKGDWPFNQQLTIYIIIAVNSFYVIAGVFALYALTTQRMFIFLWSSFILLGTFAMQLLHGVACLRASTEPMDSVIFSSFRQFSKEDNFQDWLLDFQWQYDCCGIKSYMDWRLFQLPGLPRDSVPDSCCSRKDHVPNAQCGHGLVAPNVSVDHAQSILNTAGCAREISRIYQDDIKAKGIVMLFVAFTALATGVVLFILRQKVWDGPENRQSMHSAKRTDADIGRQSQRNTSHRGSDAPSAASSVLSGIDTHRIPSYYKTAVAHKPPTGRSRVPRQDSTRNFVSKPLAQRNGPKYRMNPYQRGKYNVNYHSQGRATAKSQRGQKDLMRTKLEMLMHPIETHSTSSATPNPSDMFPFYGDQPSSSASVVPVECDKRNGNRVKNADRKITHYNSLPQVVNFPDGRLETQYHYNTSHLHAQNMRRKHSQRPKPTFVEGKYPSLTITSTLATIHEENESVRSGNSQASSTCTTTSSSSPKSLSKSPSNHLRGLLDSEAVYRQLNIASDAVLEDIHEEKDKVEVPTDNGNANDKLPSCSSTDQCNIQNDGGDKPVIVKKKGLKLVNPSQQSVSNN